MPKYYIDFESWTIEAADEDAAYEIALKRLKTEDPKICSTEPCGDDDDDTSVDAGFGGDTGRDADRW